jgi:4-amino-4-deoxy-L-arabinose transferase-like glycosyltransferase
MPLRALAVLIVVYVLYFHGMASTGLLGPDEPRYASIGREMAQSGDWVTPRLWGEPWFEKSPLLFWLTAAAFKLGFGPDVAPRLGVTLLSVAFLAFYWRALRRRFGPQAAWFSTAILGTSAAWLAFSYVGVTDLPMTAAFAAAMLLALGWLETGDRRLLPLSAALLGVAVLGKGLVPLVLAAPLAWMGRRRFLDWLRPQTAGAFLAVAAPWYLLCWLRNGEPFVRTFILEHHLGRFASETLQHVQPFWFYAPVLAAGLLPWSPLLVLLARRSLYRDRARLFLLAWVAFGFLFFSASTNKLPGYLLPLLPALAALMGIALAESKRAAAALSACALMLVATPLAAQLLPQALAGGLSRSALPAFSWIWLAPVAVAAVAWRTRDAGRAVAFVAVAAAAGVFYLKLAAFPAIEHNVSARPVWNEIAARREQVCIGGMHRAWRYGLNYYSVAPLPDCAAAPKPLELRQDEAGRGRPAPPHLTERPL